MNDEILFHQALERPPPDRAGFLNEACAGDEALRQRVQALLQAHDNPGSFLQAPVVNLALTTDSAPAAAAQVAGGPDTGRQTAPGEESGRIIGLYKLLLQIGEGGMGTVWMAEQTRPVQRKVALKIIKAGMDSRQVLARFEAERQTLALMDHPNIARVLEAGATPEGQPYFVMELVKGQPITSYCDDQQLTCRQRLELFVPVCQAIQHAHQKGIIHRDIKPSNVLVASYDGKPVVKVIDFGIAKATGSQLTERPLLTEFGAVVGTLEYMSPEQAEANQLDIDTRSDIYSLGVLLYELLTGTTPLERKRLKKAALLEVLRLIREEEPPRPSTRLSTTEELPAIAANRGLEPKRLSGLMRGELDWIVMKALEKDRNRRYETANGFAADVQRYLADEPVQACPPSTWYRFRKFARRNKTALTTATLVTAALIVGTVVSVWQATRANDALNSERNTQIILDEERTEKEEQKTRINRDLSHTLVTAAKLREKAWATGPAQSKPWADLREAVKAAEALAGNELADPELKQRVDRLSAEVKQDEFDRRTAAKIEEIRFNPDGNGGPGNNNLYLEVFKEYGIPVLDLTVEDAVARVAASSIRDALVIALDNWWIFRRDSRLLAIAHGVFDDPWRRTYFDARLKGDLAALVKLARQPETLKQPSGFITNLVNSIASYDGAAANQLLRRAHALYPGDLWVNYFHTRTVGSAEDRVAFMRVAVALRPESPELNRFMGFYLQAAGRHEEAIVFYERFLQLKPDATWVNSDLGISRGLVLEKRGQLDQAIAAYKEALRYEPVQLSIYTNLMSALDRQRAPAEAFSSLMPGFRKAVHGDGEWARRGDVLAKWGTPREAIASYAQDLRFQADFRTEEKLVELLNKSGLLEEVVAGWRKDIARNPRDGTAYIPLCVVLERNGRLNEAIAAWEQCVRDQPPVMLGQKGWMRYGDVLARAEKLDKAAVAYKKAVDLGPGLSHAHERLGGVLERAGRFEEALVAYREVLRINPVASSYRQVSGALTKLGRVDEANQLWREAVQNMPDRELHNPAGRVLELAVTLERQGRPDEAVAACRALLRDWPDLPPVLQAMVKVDFGKNAQPAERFAAYKAALSCLLFKNGYVYENLGVELTKLGLVDEGIAAWHESIRVDPKSISGHAQLAAALDKKGRLQEAADAWRTAIHLYGNPQVVMSYHTQLANVLIKAGKLDEAICLSTDYVFAQQTCDAVQTKGLLDKGVAACRKLIGEQPEAVAPHIFLAIALERQVKLPEAVAACSEWIRLQPTSEDAIVRRARLYQRLGQKEAALADYSMATAVAPKSVVAWNHRGYFLLSLGQWDKAAADFSKVLELSPKDSPALSGRSNAYFALKQWDKVAADRTRLIEIYPQNSEHWIHRGAAYNNQGLYEKGVADNSKAIELSPTYGLPWNNRAFALERLGQWEKAAADYAKAQELGYSEPMVWTGWARCQSRLGRYAEALAKLEKAPTYPAVLNEMAWLLANCPDGKIRAPRRAVELADRAVKMLPDEGTYWNTLGVARYRAGDWQAAAEALTRSMALSQGGDGNDWFVLAMAHKKLDKAVEARKLFDKAVEWMETNRPNDEELRRFRAEAAAILGLEKDGAAKKEKN